MLLLFLVVSFATNALDFSAMHNGVTINYSTTSANTVKVTHREYSGTVVIPETVTYNGVTYTVTAIGGQAFNDCQNLISLSIPATVVTIEYWGVRCCPNLISVTIPSNSSLTTIGWHAFFGATSLTSIVLPNSLTTIEELGFSHCFSLTSITLPSSLTSISKELFHNCYSLTSINIPSSVTSIGERAFVGCTNLVSIIIPSTVTSIGYEAFSGCHNLASVTLSSSLQSIAERTFYNCSSLVDITIPTSVTSIADRAFYNCRSLTSITIPPSVTEIGVSAFNGCSGLTSVKLPSYCEFIDTTDTTRIVVGNSNGLDLSFWIYDEICMSDDTILFTGFPEDLELRVSDSLFFAGVYNDSLYSVGNYTFHIDNLSFLSSDSLCLTGYITCDFGEFIFSEYLTLFAGSDTGYFMIDSNCIFMTSKFYVSFDNNINNIIVDTIYLVDTTYLVGISALWDSTFANCSSLRSITIPASLTQIGNNVFVNCAMLDTVIIDSLCNLSNTFLGGNGTTTAVDYIRINHSTPPEIYNTFYGASASNTHVYVPCGAIENYRNHAVWGCFTNYHTTTIHTSNDNQTICQNELPFSYGGIDFDATTTTGEYSILFVAQDECDSIVMLQLTINPKFHYVDTFATCDDMLPFTYNDSALTATGSYRFDYATQLGCDSVRVINLTVNPTYQHNDTLAICDNMLPYPYGDSALSVAGQYVVGFSSTNYCDSVVRLDLSIHATYQVSDSLTLCDNQLPYVYGGQTLDTMGVYNIHFTAINSCDSVITFKLHTHPAYHFTDVVSMCDSVEPYTYCDSIIADTGIYQFAYITPLGCDSIRVLNLAVYPSYQHVDTMAICENLLPYSYGDSLLTMAGDYTIGFTSAKKCDSIMSLHLMTSPTYRYADTINLCDNTLPYVYNGHELYHWGNHTLDYTTVHNCDSMIDLTLNLRQIEKSLLEMVTIELGHCKLQWTPSSDVTGYKIFREGTGSNPYDLVYIAPAGFESTWVDKESKPKSMVHRYKIVAVDDSCYSRESEASYGASIHLMISDGINNSYNLQWTPYEGEMNYTAYNIYRGPDEQNQELIATVPVSITSYSDFEAPEADVFYSVTAVLTPRETKLSKEIRSNVVSPEWQLRATQGALVISYAEGSRLYIYDALGRPLKCIERAAAEERYEVPSSGLYIVQQDGGISKKVTVLR